MSGIQECPLCDRCPVDATDQTNACRVIVPKRLIRPADRRVYTSHQGGTQGASLRRHPARLLLIPGVLAKSENRPTLKLPADYWYREAFEYAVKKIARLKI